MNNSMSSNDLNQIEAIRQISKELTEFRVKSINSQHISTINKNRAYDQHIVVLEKLLKDLTEQTNK